MSLFSLIAKGWNSRKTKHFQIEAVPNELFGVIVEKMLHHDFANFEACSLSSSQACRSISPKVKLQFYISTMALESETSVTFMNRSQNPRTVDIDTIPNFIHINTLLIDVVCKNSRLFERCTVKTTELSMLAEPCFTNADVDFLQNLLQLTQPELWLPGHTCNEAFYLPEVQKLKQMQCWLKVITDEILVNLRIEHLVIIAGDSLTRSGIYRFLMQWIRKERNFKHFKVVKMRDFDFLPLCRELEAVSDAKILKYTVEYDDDDDDRRISEHCWLCRNEGDCLRLKKEQERLEIQLCDDENRCPGKFEGTVRGLFGNYANRLF